MMRALSCSVLVLCSLMAACQHAPPATATPTAATVPPGEVKGSAVVHTDASRAALIANANVALPAGVAGPAVWFGKWRDVPAGAASAARKAPAVVFLHGSSGLGLKAIEDWQRFMAGLGVASIAPDSFALPDRITYKSPVGKDVYERIHALRASEIAPALAALRQAPWVDASRLVLAGTSEGAVAVARHADAQLRGRMIFSWSCETNYFVEAPRTAVLPEQPVLNVMSSTDTFFSSANPFIGHAAPVGHCGPVFSGAKRASVVLIPGAPHTLMMLPPARAAAQGFVAEVLVP